jgi:hypothetical protein
VGPGQGVEGGEERGLVVLDGEDELRAAFVQVAGVGTLGPDSGDVSSLSDSSLVGPASSAGSSKTGGRTSG